MFGLSIWACKIEFGLEAMICSFERNLKKLSFKKIILERVNYN